MGLTGAGCKIVQLSLDKTKEVCNNIDGSCPSKACLSTRYAEFEDLETVFGMYMAALSDIKEYVQKPNPDKCRNVVYHSWAAAPCVLVEKDGEIAGFAGLSTATPEYSDEPFLREYMFYIKPEHRSAKIARYLSECVKEVAKKFNLTLMMSHMVSGHDVAKKDKFLKRWGYDVVSLQVRYNHG